MSLDNYLRNLPGRCSTCGHHLKLQSCTCPGGDWAIFTSALRAAVRPDGTVHPCDMRPRTRGRIERHKVSSFYRRARAEGLLVEAGHERSNDEQGRNSHRMEAYFTYRAAESQERAA